MAEPLYDARTFWELLEKRANATPDHPMLLDADDRRLTFGEFRDRAERVAAGFYEMGIREGSHVTWQLPTRIETIVASFALSRLGAIQNPIIQIYREREVGFAIRQTQAELVLVPGTWRGFDYVQMVESIAAELERPPKILVAYDSLPEGDPATLPPPPPVPESPDDAPVRWIYYTSGTTSDPKGVMHTDATLIAGGIGMAKALEMTPDDVGSIAFPYAHIGGPDYIVTVLAQGFPVVLLESFVPAEAIEVFRRHGVTMAGGSTAFYIAFLNEQRKNPGQPLIPTLRLLSGGGAPKPPEVYFEVKSEMGIPVAHGYGMTECPMIAQGSPADTDDQLAYSEGAPVYRCQVDVVRPDGTPAAPGEEGEVRLSGPMLFKGYTDPKLNEEAFDEQGRFRTGDLGIKRPDGHITLTGRLKDVIIRKGENISAKEVEDILYTHPKVGDVAVIGLPDRERGERVCAVVETAPGQSPLAFEEMVEWCKKAGLMTQKIPEQLEVVEALPRNATLKVLKYQLRDQLKDKPFNG
ncbi:MAG TPA: AMP-binding protein [Acidimicrobiales bacterium]